VGKIRLKKTGKDSFFGDYVYQQVLDEDDFMVALRQLFDWGRYRERLLSAYRGKGQRGRPPESWLRHDATGDSGHRPAPRRTGRSEGRDAP